MATELSKIKLAPVKSKIKNSNDQNEDLVVIFVVLLPSSPFCPPLRCLRLSAICKDFLMGKKIYWNLIGGSFLSTQGSGPVKFPTA